MIQHTIRARSGEITTVTAHVNVQLCVWIVKHTAKVHHSWELVAQALAKGRRSLEKDILAFERSGDNFALQRPIVDQRLRLVDCQLQSHLKHAFLNTRLSVKSRFEYGLLRLSGIVTASSRVQYELSKFW